MPDSSYNLLVRVIKDGTGISPWISRMGEYVDDGIIYHAMQRTSSGSYHLLELRLWFPPETIELIGSPISFLHKHGEKNINWKIQKG